MSKLSRRKLLIGGAASAAAMHAPAVHAQRKKVVVVYGSTAIAPDINFSTSVPLGAGFFAEEGLDVEVVSANVSSAAIAMLANDRAQFCATATNILYSSVDSDVPIRSFICQIPDSFYALAVLSTSGIREPTDLKGTIIGVPSLAGGTILLLKVVLRNAGVDPDKDVELLGVGSGLPALDALQRGRVHALFLWDEPFSLFEANGFQLRYFAPNPIPQLGFTFGTFTTSEILNKQPELVASMARALSRALVFCANADLDELAKLHFKVFPEARPGGMTESDAIRENHIRLKNRYAYMRFKQRVFERSEKLGDETDSRILLGRNLLLQGGELKHEYPADAYFTRKFVDDMNRIDVASIAAKAKVFRAG